MIFINLKQFKNRWRQIVKLLCVDSWCVDTSFGFCNLNDDMAGELMRLYVKSNCLINSSYERYMISISDWRVACICCYQKYFYFILEQNFIVTWSIEWPRYGHLIRNSHLIWLFCVYTFAIKIWFFRAIKKSFKESRHQPQTLNNQCFRHRSVIVSPRTNLVYQ